LPFVADAQVSDPNVGTGTVIVFDETSSVSVTF
jgi:hypothetical protein